MALVGNIFVEVDGMHYTRTPLRFVICTGLKEEFVAILIELC